MKRKSWFRRSRGDLPPTKADDGQEVIIDDQNDPERLRPLHFSPNRIATLYVTPSERNLYLAAMSALDKGPPPLPLWSESPPTLPLLPSQPPNGHFTSSSTDWTHLTTLPKSPKFVTSPDMPEDGNGLTVRDEFRRIPPRSTKYAFLSLNPPSGTRFTGFPVETFLAVDAVFLEKWPAGVRKRSESFEGLRARGNSHESLSWTTELSGKVWKRKGHQELDSIRLLLALFTVLGVYGWKLIDSLQAAGYKVDSHTLLFTLSSETMTPPPLFFALSLPLPDRISLISPPPISTPALISAIRNAITSGSQGRSGGNATSTSNRVTWSQKGEKGIRLEGWVHQGVYRFWLNGMRRWLGGGIKQKAVDNLHPRLLLAIIDSLSALHFELTASLPLRPLEKGRDILIFTSLPTSGLSHRDTYQSQPAQQEASQPESPVIVDMPPVPPPHDEVRHVDPEHRGLPWTSVLDEGPSTSPSNLPANDARLSTQAPPSAMPAPPDSRAESSASPYPLIPGSDQGMPRQRNVLVKKSLLRRRASVATNNSIRQSSDSIRSPSDSNQPADSIRHPSDPVRHPSDSIRYPSDPIRLPAAPHLHQAGDVNAIGDERVPRVDAVPQWNSSSYEGHHSADKSVDSAESRDSAYVDVDEDQPVGPLMLGVSMREAESPVPLRDVATRNRPTMVDVGGGIRIPSTHGSVGYLGRQSGMSGYTGSTPSGSELDRRPSGGDLGKRTSIGDAKGKAREVVWPEFEGNGGRGFGSARTRVSIGSR